MAETGARLLRLLGMLQHRRFWPGGDLAARLAISPRTLRRDVERLRSLGYAVQSSPGVDGGYQLEAGTAMPPLLLDDEEATALVVGLQTSAHGAVSGIADASLRALGKVMQTLPASVRKDVDAIRSATVTSPFGELKSAVPADTLAVVAQACHGQVRLRFGYLARDGAETHRSVEPHRIVTVGRRFYLVAYDLDRQDWRTFRLDRISDADPARNQFDPRPPPADDIAAYVRDSIESITATHHVSALVEADAESVRDQIGRWATVEPDGVGRSLVTMTTDSLDWAAFSLVTLEWPFSIEEPEELRAHLRLWVDRLTPAADPTNADGGAHPKRVASSGPSRRA